MHDQPETAEALHEGLVALSHQLELLERMTGTIEGLMKDNDDGKYRKHDPKLVGSLTSVARTTKDVAAEIRKLEAHHKRRVEELEPKERDALVKAYIMKLPVDRRRELIEEVGNYTSGLLGNG